MDSLKSRIKKSNLSGRDIDTILSILKLVVSLRSLGEKRRVNLLLWLRRIFGVKTEKSQRSSDQTKRQGSSPPKKKGRYGRNDYPGADRSNVRHPELNPDDPCPECHDGKLREIEPGVDYDWQGQSPIHLHIYLLQRFICHRCKEIFTAPSPVAETAKTVDDSDDAVKVTKCNRNAMANAVIACLRFMFGIPFYRLAKIQDRMGIGLPEANQYAMIAQVYDAALPVYGGLIYQAGQGSLIMADDTAIKILDWLRGKGPPVKKTGNSRKKAQTTAIVSKSAEGQSIALYLTDEKQAGRHVENLLELRQTESGVPIYMCDGLSSNKAGDSHELIQVHCLDHARRLFYEIQSIFPEESQFVIDRLAKVYEADSDCRKLGLHGKQRQSYHKQHSAGVMKELGEWMVRKMESGEVEENSPLGKAINYSLKRWTELNEFLYTPGVPLSNAECERSIKRIITHGKNSLFYKTAKGAHVGDVIQSLITTCQDSGVNCFKYLAWLQENKSQVKVNPADFLPWCLPS
jgi:hypothetical protein